MATPPDQKISDLTAQTAMAATDVMEVETTGPASKKITWANLAQAAYDYLTSLTAKTTLADADQVGLADSAASNVGKKITFANFRTQLYATTATRTVAGAMSALDKDERWERFSRYVLHNEFLTLAEIMNQSVSGAGAAFALSVGTSTAGGTIAGHPGLIQATTGTTTTGRATGWALLSASTSGMRLGGGMRLGLLFELDQLSLVGEEFILRFGVGETTATEPADGMYFVYDRLTSVNWLGKTANGGVRTTASGGTAVPVATGWQFLEIIVSSDAATIDFQVNGVSIGTSTTNLPVTTSGFYMGMVQLLKSAGTTPVTVVYDACGFRQDFTTARNV